MSVRLTTQQRRVALYDSTTDIAFGPTFSDETDAEHFLTWLIVDPRTLSPAALQEQFQKWSNEVADDAE